MSSLKNSAKKFVSNILEQMMYSATGFASIVILNKNLSINELSLYFLIFSGTLFQGLAINSFVQMPIILGGKKKSSGYAVYGLVLIGILLLSSVLLVTYLAKSSNADIFTRIGAVGFMVSTGLSELIRAILISESASKALLWHAGLTRAVIIGGSLQVREDLLGQMLLIITCGILLVELVIKKIYLKHILLFPNFTYSIFSDVKYEIKKIVSHGTWATADGIMLTLIGQIPIFLFQSNSRPGAVSAFASMVQLCSIYSMTASLMSTTFGSSFIKRINIGKGAQYTVILIAICAMALLVMSNLAIHFLKYIMFNIDIADTIQIWFAIISVGYFFIIISKPYEWILVFKSLSKPKAIGSVAILVIYLIVVYQYPNLINETGVVITLATTYVIQFIFLVSFVRIFVKNEC